jgi:dolichol-phosphate mannosyltransferase
MSSVPDRATDSPPTLTIVVPVYNERENLSALLARLTPVLDRVALPAEVVFVDDGSRDGTPEQISALSGRNPGIRLVRLARNFGHQAALFAGLEHARGQAVITLDGDLQHPPELIPELVRCWQDGYDVVQAVRRRPADESPLKRAGSRTFYRLLSSLTRIRVTPGAADFRLLARPALDAFLDCRERVRFNRGLVQWIGFRYVEVPYDAEPRHAGRSKYSYRAMLRLAGDAIFSFSWWPLRLAGLAGAGVSLAAAAYLAFVLWARFFTDRTLEGWSSILAAVLILGGFQLVVLWILGEYVGRLYEEVKQRPIYIARPPPVECRSDLSGGAAREQSASSTASAPPCEAPRADPSAAFATSRSGPAPLSSNPHRL